MGAALLNRAIGKQLHCVFVDHGLMRHQEGDHPVGKLYSPMVLEVRGLQEDLCREIGRASCRERV